MIFHLLYYLQTRLPGIDFVALGELPGDPQEKAFLMEYAGQVRGYPDNRQDPQVQITVRNSDQFVCREQAESIFALLRELHNVTLNPHPEDVTGAAPIRFGRIAATSGPIPEGRDTDGLFTFRLNFVLTYWSPLS